MQDACDYVQSLGLSQNTKDEVHAYRLLTKCTRAAHVQVVFAPKTTESDYFSIIGATNSCSKHAQEEKMAWRVGLLSILHNFPLFFIMNSGMRVPKLFSSYQMLEKFSSGTTTLWPCASGGFATGSPSTQVSVLLNPTSVRFEIHSVSGAIENEPSRKRTTLSTSLWSSPFWSALVNRFRHQPQNQEL